MFLKPFQNLVLWSLICVSPATVFANSQTKTIEKDKLSKSISYQKSDLLSDDTRQKRLKAAPVDKSNTQLLQLSTQTAARHSSFDFSVYDASTSLLNDDDYDGFYHRFSVTIDADTLFEHATVYADLYLSYEGGPWIYYASSQHYNIHSDSFNDAFTIETELADGYPTGYYDMKIELYDSVTDDYLLTYNNLDDASLVAIPLEDSHRDQVEYYEPIESEIIISHGVGSLNLLSLITLFILIIALRLSRIFNLTPNFIKDTK